MILVPLPSGVQLSPKLRDFPLRIISGGSAMAVVGVRTLAKSFASWPVELILAVTFESQWIRNQSRSGNRY